MNRIPTGHVIVTATVIAPGSPNVPTGTVTFLDGTNTLGTRPLDINGVTNYPTPSLATGSHSITAKYEGPSNFLPSTSMPLVQAVSEGSQTTPLNCTTPFVPNLPSPPFWPDLWMCFFVTVLAFAVAYFLPGVLQRLAPKPPAVPPRSPSLAAVDPEPPRSPSPEAITAFKLSVADDLGMPLSSEQALAKDSTQKPKLTCEQKLAKDWKKLSQPQYAIGQGLMLRSDFQNLQESYYSQSLISIGLILPFFLLVFAFLLKPQFGFGGAPLYVMLGVGEVLLLITGVDRRHKYLTELDGLIASAFLKTCAQQRETEPPIQPIRAWQPRYRTLSRQRKFSRGRISLLSQAMRLHRQPVPAPGHLQLQPRLRPIRSTHLVSKGSQIAPQELRAKIAMLIVTARNPLQESYGSTGYERIRAALDTWAAVDGDRVLAIDDPGDMQSMGLEASTGDSADIRRAIREAAHDTRR